ncbi:XRE family transcriptional regulator [Scytonema sp. HK-05]|uniref:helix-turn-helix transcriptional regulator n=1 Tax=Scytonema sp. HK-05 TaxID=1137095 RepID=UPI0009377A4B|nr:helix-turn-helix transcriptional regulator [Scytonema sp. HK-05]OKH49739.1 transcriptional regulator [Scytonema sp. HK-05]BAY44630.1 XRE family transcriptional regulator [Scytonema sp. HK-05]
MKNRLKELRQLHQCSQSDLARELGVSRQAVNGFESGKFDPSLDMAFKIASLFKVALEEVFIYEAQNSMQTLVERFKNYFGFEFGFERFTEKAINAVKFARSEATRLQKSQVEPEHLFAGLLADPTTTSARLLRANGCQVDIETNEHSFELRENPKFSPESKFVLELALQVVRLQDKKSIGTEHLLWGLLRLAETDKTTVSELFQRYEIDLEALNNQLAETV